MSTLTYSILISSRNEGDALRRTVDSLLLNPPEELFEIIVVDDGSDDASAEFLTDPAYGGRQAKVVRNESWKGLIFSRARAADLARGVYLCVLDAHCCVTSNWAERLASHLRLIDGRGLVVPHTQSLDPTSWTVESTSCSQTACTISTPFLDFSWCDPQRIDGLRCTTTIPGGAWMCTRDWYREIGGLDRGMIGWGGENIDIALRTWVLGGWCLVAGDVHVGHLFADGKKRRATRRPRDEPRDGGLLTPAPSAPPNPRVALLANKIRAAHNVFAKETLTKIIDNLKYLPEFKMALELIRNDAESLARIKDHVETRRNRSDRWLIETFDLPVVEAPFFHCRPPGARGERRPRARPRVSVVISDSGGDNLARLVSSVLEYTSYARYEILVLSDAPEDEARESLEGELRSESLRLRFLQNRSRAGGGIAANFAALRSDAAYLVFLTEDAETVEPHWLEKLILLFERRPRLLLASPRISAPRRPEGERDAFDVTWDWKAPLFSRQRVGKPLDGEPYQALSCPETCFMVARERFLALGGFDRTIRDGPCPVMELAVHGWFSGYEVLCHPGVTVRLTGLENGAAPPRVSEEWRDYGRALIAMKYFEKRSRFRRALDQSLAARRLLARHGSYIERRRRAIREYARFDEDWLFYKFGIEDDDES